MENNAAFLSVKEVSKTFGSTQILKNINFSLKSGEVIGIVGKNGSGKTTLLKTIMGLIYPDDGEIIVGGNKVTPGFLGKLPVNLGALIENPVFLPQFTGFQNLSMLASIRNKIDNNTVSEFMNKVDLDPNNKKAVSKYSLGMKQRLGIAQAIMEDPDIVLFDEPTNALDTDGVKIFEDIIKDMTSKGTSFIIVSHREDEIDRLCNRVYKIDKGELFDISKEKIQ